MASKFVQEGITHPAKYVTLKCPLKKQRADIMPHAVSGEVKRDELKRQRTAEIIGDRLRDLHCAHPRVCFFWDEGMRGISRLKGGSISVEP